MKKNITDIFVTSLWAANNKEFDTDTVDTVKNCIIDYLGVTFSGALKNGNKSDELVKLNIGNQGNGPIIGRRQRTSLLVAALVNGINAHTLELDDGHRAAMVHSGAVIMSALFSVADDMKINANDFVHGVVIGYEAAIRLSMAIQPAHKHKGYHVTGTCGTVGAAIAIAAAKRMDKTGFKRALSAAATSAGGLLEIIEDKSELKPYNAGRAAMDGVAAALMALSGFEGPDDVLGGDRGFLNVMTEDAKVEHLEFSAAEELKIKTIYQKPYAACRYCHAPIDAVFKLKANNRVTIEEIEEIAVDTFSLAVKGHDHSEISGISSAKMSIPYSVAVSLITGQAGIEQFSDSFVSNDEIKALAKKVKVNADEEISGWVPAKRAAKVTIKFFDGTTVEYREDYPKGEPENPITEYEMKEKFGSLTRYVGLSDDKVNDIISSVKEFHNSYEKLLMLL